MNEYERQRTLTFLRALRDRDQKGIHRYAMFVSDMTRSGVPRSEWEKRWRERENMGL